MDLSLRLYDDAVELEPRFAEAIEAQGEALDVMGHSAVAAKKYEAARRVRADTRLGAPDRHFVLRQRGEFVAEIMAYDSVVRSLRKNTLPYLARGNAYLAAGRPDSALADYNRALRLKPKVPELIALKGEALSMLGRYAEALQSFDIALTKKPNDTEMLNARAIALMALGHVEKANADWRRQFELLRDYADARACVAIRMADYEAALSPLESALAKAPGDPYWQLYLLAARCRLGLSSKVLNISKAEVWPGPLLALHVGAMDEEEVYSRADTNDRRTEATFQIGIKAYARDRALAEQSWRKVINSAKPSMIEYAAARNELSRLS